MKTSIPLFLLSAGSLAPTEMAAQTVACEPIGYQTDSIDLFEIRKVGKGSVPLAKIFGLESLTGQVYIEVEPDQLDGENKLFVEYYANVNQDSTDDCKARGTLIDEDFVDVRMDTFAYPSYNSAYEPQEQDECFPRTSNGQVAAVEFTFINPFYDGPAPMKIWDPTKGTKDGVINFCVRVGFKRDINGSDELELISFIDTKISVDVDLTANFNSFEQNVEITSEQATDFETEVTASMDVNAFLCGDPEENDGFPFGESFGLGQTFRICVDVTEEYKDEYKLTGFENVICENDIETREMVKDGNSDPLTKVETVVAGSKNFGGSFTATESAIAIESVITSGFFNPNGDDSSFSCRGEVELEYIGGDVTLDRRSLSITIEQVEEKQQQKPVVRRMISGNSSPFVTKVNLSSNGNEGSAAASFPRRGIIINTTLAVAIGFISSFMIL